MADDDRPIPFFGNSAQPSASSLFGVTPSSKALKSDAQAGKPVPISQSSNSYKPSSTPAPDPFGYASTTANGGSSWNDFNIDSSHSQSQRPSKTNFPSNAPLASKSPLKKTEVAQGDASVLFGGSTNNLTSFAPNGTAYDFGSATSYSAPISKAQTSANVGVPTKSAPVKRTESSPQSKIPVPSSSPSPTKASGNIKPSAVFASDLKTADSLFGSTTMSGGWASTDDVFNDILGDGDALSRTGTGSNSRNISSLQLEAVHADPFSATNGVTTGPFSNTATTLNSYSYGTDLNTYSGFRTDPVSTASKIDAGYDFAPVDSYLTSNYADSTVVPSYNQTTTSMPFEGISDTQNLSPRKTSASGASKYTSHPADVDLEETFAATDKVPFLNEQKEEISKSSTKSPSKEKALFGQKAEEVTQNTSYDMFSKSTGSFAFGDAYSDHHNSEASFEQKTGSSFVPNPNDNQHLQQTTDSSQIVDADAIQGKSKKSEDSGTASYTNVEGDKNDLFAPTTEPLPTHNVPFSYGHENASSSIPFSYDSRSDSFSQQIFDKAAQNITSDFATPTLVEGSKVKSSEFKAASSRSSPYEYATPVTAATNDVFSSVTHSDHSKTSPYDYSTPGIAEMSTNEVSANMAPLNSESEGSMYPYKSTTANASKPESSTAKTTLSTTKQGRSRTSLRPQTTDYADYAGRNDASVVSGPFESEKKNEKKNYSSYESQAEETSRQHISSVEPAMGAIPFDSNIGQSDAFPTFDNQLGTGASYNQFQFDTYTDPSASDTNFYTDMNQTTGNEHNTDIPYAFQPGDTQPQASMSYDPNIDYTSHAAAIDPSFALSYAPEKYYESQGGYKASGIAEDVTSVSQSNYQTGISNYATGYQLEHTEDPDDLDDLVLGGYQKKYAVTPDQSSQTNKHAPNQNTTEPSQPVSEQKVKEIATYDERVPGIESMNGEQPKPQSSLKETTYSPYIPNGPVPVQSSYIPALRDDPVASQIPKQTEVITPPNPPQKEYGVYKSGRSSPSNKSQPSKKGFIPPPTTAAMTKTSPDSTYVPSVSNTHEQNYGYASTQLEDDRLSVQSMQSNVDLKLCSNCKKPNDPDSNFCSKCGTSLANATPVRSSAAKTIQASSQSSVLPNVPSHAVSTYVPRVPSPANSIRSSRENNRFSAPLNADREGSVGSDSSYGYYPQDVYRSQSAPYLSSQAKMFADPLNRTGCPVVHFGFGGKLFVMFPKKSQRYTTVNGSTHVVEKNYPGAMKLYSMRKIMEARYPSVMQSLISFPGPSVKNRKKEFLKWLDNYLKNVTSITDGNTLSPIISLLKLAVESDGKLFTANNYSDIVIKQILQVSENTQIDVPMNQLNPPSNAATSQITNLLLSGKRDEAVQYALSSGLYTQALIIAAHVDKSAYDSVIRHFAAHVLSPSDPTRTLFQVFGGCNLDEEHLDFASNWREHLAILLANRSANDHQALARLGNAFLKGGLLGPAQLCYIISGVAFGSPDGSNMAVVLLGHNHLVHGPTLNVEAIQLTEIYEYTQRLQVSDYLLPHFQIYRLLFGRQLCDWGLVEEAQKYCDDILSALKTYSKGSPFFNMQFGNMLKEFSELLANMTGSAANSNARESVGWLAKGIFDVFDRSINKFIGSELEEKDKNAKKPVGPQPGVNAPQPSKDGSSAGARTSNHQALSNQQSYPSSVYSTSTDHLQPTPYLQSNNFNAQPVSYPDSYDSKYPPRSQAANGYTQNQSENSSQKSDVHYQQPYGNQSYYQSTDYSQNVGNQSSQFNPQYNSYDPNQNYASNGQSEGGAGTGYPYGQQASYHSSQKTGQTQAIAGYPYTQQTSYQNTVQSDSGSGYPYTQQTSYQNAIQSDAGSGYSYAPQTGAYQSAGEGESGTGYLYGQQNQAYKSPDPSETGGGYPYGQDQTYQQAESNGAVDGQQYTSPYGNYVEPQNQEPAGGQYTSSYYGDQNATHTSHYQSGTSPSYGSTPQQQVASQQELQKSPIDTIPSSKGMKLPGDDLDDDDFLGNKKTPAPGEQSKAADSQPSTQERPASDSGLLGKLYSIFSRQQSASAQEPAAAAGPVKANLGESGGFHYDPVQKKWVMSGTKAEESRPGTPAAPPTDTGFSRPPSTGPNAPPSTPNVRSALSSRAASPAPNSATSDPLMAVNRRSSSRKSARSRYVDTLNPESSGDSEMKRNSFLPPPSTVNAVGATMPRIMAPGPRQQQSPAADRSNGDLPQQ